MAENSQHAEMQTLFKQTLVVFNEAMEKADESMTYRPIVAAAERLLGGKHIGVAVYKDDPNTPFDYFTIKIEDGRFHLVSHGKETPDITWKVSRSYLQEVAGNPQRYIDNPALLDWDWLKSRLQGGS